MVMAAIGKCEIPLGVIFNDPLGREGGYISSSGSESDAMVPDDETAMVVVKEGRRRRGPTRMRTKRSQRSKGKKKSTAGKKLETLGH